MSVDHTRQHREPLTAKGSVKRVHSFVQQTLIGPLPCAEHDLVPVHKGLILSRFAGNEHARSSCLQEHDSLRWGSDPSAEDLRVPFSSVLPPTPPAPTRHYQKLHLNKQEQHLVLDEVMSGFPD